MVIGEGGDNYSQSVDRNSASFNEPVAGAEPSHPADDAQRSKTKRSATGSLKSLGDSITQGARSLARRAGFKLDSAKSKASVKKTFAQTSAERKGRDAKEHIKSLTAPLRSAAKKVRQAFGNSRLGRKLSDATPVETPPAQPVVYSEAQMEQVNKIGRYEVESFAHVLSAGLEKFQEIPTQDPTVIRDPQGLMRQLNRMADAPLVGGSKYGEVLKAKRDELSELIAQENSFVDLKAFAEELHQLMTDPKFLETGKI